MRDENHEIDSHLQMLAGLTPHEPDRSCADRIRARCHARAVRRKQVQADTSTATARAFGQILEPSLVVAGCVMFLCEVLRRALLLYRF
jgi:hypothetical protein